MECPRCKKFDNFRIETVNGLSQGLTFRCLFCQFGFFKNTQEIAIIIEKHIDIISELRKMCKQLQVKL